jgi:hypothetical protein
MNSAVTHESTELNLVSADHELSAALLDHIQQLNQGEVLRFWERLSTGDREHLSHQLAQLDWDFVESHATEHAPAEAQLSVDSHVTPPSRSIRWPESTAERHS